MEDSTTTQPSLFQHAIRWGLIMGGISIALTVLLYVVDYTLMVQLKFLFVSLLIYMGMAIYAGMDYRKSVGGFLGYGKAFQHGLVAFAISGLVSTLFGLVLYNVIDSELPQKLVDASVENARAMMEQFGAPEDSIEQGLEKARADTADRFTILGQAKGYIWIVVVSAIMSLITSLFVKKNQPIEM